MSDATSIVIVDDHVLVRKGLRTVLNQHDDLAVVGEAGTVQDAVDVVRAAEPDLVLLDVRLGSEDGIDVALQLRDDAVDVKVLVLSAHDSEDHLRDAMAAGASGYLLKSVSAEDLASGIRRAAAGEVVIGPELLPKLLKGFRDQPLPAAALTTREQEVLSLAAEGHGNPEIATRLGISPRTAQKHMERVLRKLGARDRVGAVAQALKRGLLQ